MKAQSRREASPGLKPAVRARIAYQRFKQFFALPRCYRRVRALKECPRSRIGLARDLIVLFFSYKTFPDHYALCRLWEVEEKDWKYYYGSNYHPHQRTRMRAFVRQVRYGIVFADKFLCTMYCKGMGIPSPYTYGILDPAEDYASRIRGWLQAAPAQTLIIKPLYGQGGAGIVIARKSGDGIIVREAAASLPLEEFVLEKRAIVQEVLRQDTRMAAFSPASVNTLRVLTILTRRGEAIVASGAMRAGVGESYVDNWSAGGVAVGIDCRRGVFEKFAYDKKSNRYLSHPTSGIVFEGHPVPEWTKVLEAATAIQRGFPFNRMLGVDLAIDENGVPVLIEINGACDLTAQEQWTGPLLASEPVLRAFGEYGLLVNKHQRRLYAALAGTSPAVRERG